VRVCEMIRADDHGEQTAKNQQNLRIYKNMYPVHGHLPFPGFLPQRI
jgi:hypothetical protein